MSQSIEEFYFVANYTFFLYNEYDYCVCSSTALDTPSASQQSSRTESNSSRTNDIRIENFDIAFGDK